MSCDVQENYVEMLKGVEECGREHGSVKKMKVSYGEGRAVLEHGIDPSEVAADWVLLDPRIWVKALKLCV